MATAKNPPAGLRLVKTSLAEQAYDELKRQILNQQLRPGERLNIDALSRSSGISSSPLREALVKLGAEGLVVFAANAGFSVAPVPDAAHMRHLMDYRLMVESHCARVGAAKGAAEAIAAMRRATDTMATLRESGQTYRQYRLYLDQEQAFHQALVDSAGNPVISRDYQDLHLLLSVARLSMTPDSRNIGSDDAVREHRAVIAAFEARNPDAAEAAVRGHLGAAQHRMDRAAPADTSAALARPGQP